MHKKIQKISTEIGLLQVEDCFYQHLSVESKSRNTLKNYKTDIACFNQFLEEKDKMNVQSDINLDLLREYHAYLQNRYSSDNSRRRRIQTLRIFFDYLVKENIVESNFVRLLAPSPKFLDIPHPAKPGEIIALWNHLLDDGKIYSDAMTNDNDKLQSMKNKEVMKSLLALRNQILFLLIYTSALKVSDLTELNLDDIFLDNSTSNKSAKVLISQPDRDPYTVPVNQQISKIFIKYKKKLAQICQDEQFECKKLFFYANQHKIISTGLSARGIELIFEEYGKILQIKITPKSLRQACIFKWIHQGYSDGQIKEWLGVAPSYTLKMYKDAAMYNIYNDDFIL